MYPVIKRFNDIIASLLIIIIMIPLFILIGLIIFLLDFHNPIFSHKRVGKNATLFSFYKFRSMPINTPNVESNELEEIKITFFGKLIRRLNLDELPQFFSILIGDMSLIGPRPPIPSQTNLINIRKENGSIKLLPGLTGWAQVNSYDNMPDYEKAALDGYYYKHVSFLLDLKIILLTLFYLTKPPPSY